MLYSKKVIKNGHKINSPDNKSNKSVNIEQKKNKFFKSIQNKLLLKISNFNTINNYKEKGVKYFAHKKYVIKDATNSPILKGNINKINIKNANNYYLTQNITSEKPLIFNELEISPIKSLNKNMNILFPEETKGEKNDKDNSIRIIKTTPEKKFKINPNQAICIGLNLENDSCQLSLIEQNTNDIQIICFKKDIYNLPTLIYLDEKNEEIKIGHDAENENKQQIIFDLIKLYGKNSEEILAEKKKYPFQLFQESNGRFFIKMNYYGKKDKKFYVENLLILYLEHLFKILFNKIIIEEDKKSVTKNSSNNILDINICITIPSYFSYVKRKILEKIFQKHIFQNISINQNYNCNNNFSCDINNNSIYSISLSSSKQSTASIINYNNFKSAKKNGIKTFELKLNNIKIVNSPNSSILCFQNNNNDYDNNDESIYSSFSFSFQSCSKENNILILYVSNDISNISISINSISNQKIESNYKGKSQNQYIKKYKVINNINLNINEQNIANNNDLFDKIISEIRNILNNSKLAEIYLDDIILIGDMSKCSQMKKKLKELFVNNTIIYNKLNEYNFENDDFYLVSGAALESTSNLNKLNNYIFKDVCPLSFGIENINGEVDLFIKRGENKPCFRRNFVKFCKEKNSNFVEINIYEINEENSQIVLSSSQLDCQKMKLFNDGYNKVENDYVELLFEFDIDENFNLSVFILDRKTFKKKCEFSINIDVIKE